MAQACPYCTDERFAAPSKKLLSRHIKLVHSQEPSFSIQCSQCSRTFINFRSYNNHIRIKHSSACESFDQEISTNVDTGETEQDQLALNAYSVSSQSENQPDSQVPVYVSGDSKSLTRYCAKWILKTGETRKLTRHALIGVVQDTSEFFNLVLDIAREQVTNVLKCNSVDSAIISTVMNIFSKENTNLWPFQSLLTFPLQLKYYRENFDLIVSILLYNVFYTFHTGTRKDSS